MPRVLYVEDNAENRLLVRRILLASDHEFELMEAASADAGINMARQNPPDVILMDISLPGTDGLSATYQIRAIETLKHIPIIAVTALAMSGDRERFLQAGCDGYIAKPIDVDRLPQEILAFVGSRHD